LTTAGNLVFQVINDGRFLAYSADRGDKLMEIQTNLGSGMGPPITFEMDGAQYVALTGGVGQPAGNAGPQNRATNPPRILVFKLDGTAALPEPPPPPPAPAK
jgi:quinohemoprotein ethanol dehydrogenase